MQGIEDERHQAWPGNDDNITIIIIIIIGYSLAHLTTCGQHFSNLRAFEYHKLVLVSISIYQ